ncbi:hypothetical protein E2C01_050396 [Portunus trituberculatus]|uniref:Uncharacterized protein n=1 Tax=Portunus trituberculatus TaxID=210409 RepID=A0A5B7GGA4_PORTR|nr:hypothetical protein [Portunus trituberculatus]
MGRCHICSPPAPPVKNRTRGSSCPSQDTGISLAFPCIRHTGRQAPLMPWHLRCMHGQTPPAEPDWDHGKRLAHALSLDRDPDLYL